MNEVWRARSAGLRRSPPGELVRGAVCGNATARAPGHLLIYGEQHLHRILAEY